MAFKWFKKKSGGQDNAVADEKIEKSDHPRIEDAPIEEDVPKVKEQASETENGEAQDAPPVEPETPPGPTPQKEDAKPPKKSKGLFSRLKSGLAKTRQILTTDIEDLFSGGRIIDDDMLEELEELLITSDIGVQTAMDLIEHVSNKASKISDAEELKAELKSEILKLLAGKKVEPEKPHGKPHVVMVVGVNGVGKTTTIGKLSATFAASGKKVLIAAADTFRAAAIEQLTIWAERSGADIVKHRDGSDPAAVAFDSMEAAVARDADVVLVDTAGRLHTKVNLMEELKKIKRAVSKKTPGAPHEVLLVLDATTGQNALSQAKLFNDAMEVTGIALTKLDGTAKGGIVISICSTLNVPLRYIGVGEKIDDLQRFDPEKYVDAIF